MQAGRGAGAAAIGIADDDMWWCQMNQVFEAGVRRSPRSVAAHASMVGWYARAAHEGLG